MTARRTLTLRPDVVYRMVDAEVVLLDSASSQYFSINGTGAVLWEALVAGADEEQLRARLLELYDVSAPTAEADVKAFVDALVRLGLLEISE